MIPRFFRWVFVLLLFFYLFALVTTLFEAHGFQQLVSRLIVTENDVNGEADRYRRRVLLLAVREAAIQNPDAGWIAEGKDAPVVDDAPRPKQPVLELADMIAARLPGIDMSIDQLSELQEKERFEFVDDARAGRRGSELFGQLVANLRDTTTQIADTWTAEVEEAAAAAERSRSVSDTVPTMSTQAKNAGANPPEPSPSPTPQAPADAAADRQDAPPADAPPPQTGAEQTAVATPPDTGDGGDTADATSSFPAEQAATGTVPSSQDARTTPADQSKSSAAPATEGGHDKPLRLPALTLMKLTREHGRLAQYKLRSRAGSKSVADAPEIQKQYDALIKALNERITVLNKPMVPAAERDSYRDALLAYTSDLSDLATLVKNSRGSFAPVLVSSPDRDTAGGVAETWRKPPTTRQLSLNENDPQRDPTVAWLRFWLDDAGYDVGGNLSDDAYDRKLSEAVAAFVRKQEESRPELPKDTSPSIVGGNVRRLLGDHIAEQEKTGRIRFTSGGEDPADSPSDDGTKRDIGPLLEGLRTQVGQLADNLDDEDPVQQMLLGLYRPLAQMESAALALSHMRAEPREDSTDREKSSTSGDAGPIFDEAVRRLRDAYAQLDAQLRQTKSPLWIITRAMGENVRDPQRHAAAIWRAYQEIGRLQFILTPLPDIEPFGYPIYLSKFGFEAKLLATAGLQMVDLMVVFVMGAIGSLIFITQYQLREAVQGRLLEEGYGRSFAWFVFRPLFGIVMAFALYLLYKAGQIALGSGDTGALSSDVNLPILSILSLFAGLLSWHALDMIQRRGERFFKNAKNADMWATGLKNAMQLKSVDAPELAGHLGVVEVQVRRWVELVDLVNAEMQDRIASFLDFPVVQLFNSVLPETSVNCRMAKGLSAQMNEMGITAKKLAAELRVDEKLVEQWARVERCVAAVYHRRLLDTLATTTTLLFGEEETEASAQTGAGAGGATASTDAASGAAEGDTVVDQDPLGDDFEPGDPDAPALWAVGLRKALLEHIDPSSALLADALGVPPEQVRAWMELEEAVPAEFQDDLLAELPSTEPLFAPEKPDDLIVIAEPETITEALSEDVAFADVSTGERLPHLAELMDVDVDKVDGWMQRREPMAPATAARLRDLLAGAIDDDVFAPSDHPGSEADA